MASLLEPNFMWGCSHQVGLYPRAHWSLFLSLWHGFCCPSCLPWTFLLDLICVSFSVTNLSVTRFSAFSLPHLLDRSLSLLSWSTPTVFSPSLIDPLVFRLVYFRGSTLSHPNSTHSRWVAVRPFTNASQAPSILRSFPVFLQLHNYRKVSNVNFYF